MRWFFGLEDVQHHRYKSVHSIGVLTLSIFKVLSIERIKGSKC